MAAVHGSNADIIGNGYVLSEFLNSISASGSREPAETTTFKKKSKTYIPGHKDTSLNLEGVFDGDPGSVDEIMWAALGGGTGVFSYIPEGRETAGNRVYTMDATFASYEISTDVGDVAQISAELAMGEQGRFERGQVSKIYQLESASGQGVGINSGLVGGSSNGGGLVVHATAANSLTVFLQDSADGTTWADLPGSLSMGSVRGSKRLSVTGNVRRHLRARWTGSGTFIAIVERY